MSPRTGIDYRDELYYQIFLYEIKNKFLSLLVFRLTLETKFPFCTKTPFCGALSLTHELGSIKSYRNIDTATFCASLKGPWQY